MHFRLARRVAEPFCASCCQPRAWLSPWVGTKFYPYALKKWLGWEILTWNKWHAVQRVPHLVWDNDGLSLHRLTLDGIPLLACVLNERLEILTLERIHAVKEIVPWWNASLRHLVREMSHEPLVLLHVRPEVGNAEFIVVWDLYHLDSMKWDELLLTCYDLSEKIFVSHQFGWDIELH